MIVPPLLKRSLSLTVVSIWLWLSILPVGSVSLDRSLRNANLITFGYDLVLDSRTTSYPESGDLLLISIDISEGAKTATLSQGIMEIGRAIQALQAGTIHVAVFGCSVKFTQILWSICMLTKTKEERTTQHRVTNTLNSISFIHCLVTPLHVQSASKVKFTAGRVMQIFVLS